MKIRKIFLAIVLCFFGIAAFSQTDLIDWNNNTNCHMQVRYDYESTAYNGYGVLGTLLRDNSGVISVPYDDAELTSLEIRLLSGGAWEPIILETFDNYTFPCDDCGSTLNVVHDDGIAPIILKIECD